LIKRFGVEVFVHLVQLDIARILLLDHLRDALRIPVRAPIEQTDTHGKPLLSAQMRTLCDEQTCVLYFTLFLVRKTDRASAPQTPGSRMNIATLPAAAWFRHRAA